MELYLTNADFDHLITLTKHLLKKYEINVSVTEKGEIQILSKTSDTKFCLNYFIRPGKVSLNFRELTYNYCLIRINLNDGFHKNADNVRIWGNRINIFSETEFHDKADYKTYMKSYSLPYLNFNNTSDPGEQILELLEYTNTEYHNKLNISNNLF